MMLTIAEIHQHIKHQDLTRQSATQANLRLGGILLTYIAATAIGIWANSLVLWLGIWGLQSFILGGLYSGIHHAVHGNLYPSKRLNLLVGYFISSLLLVNFELYKQSHFQHHKYTRVPGDPDTYPGADVKFSNLCQYFQFYFKAGICFPYRTLQTSWRTMRGDFPFYCSSKKQRSAFIRSSIYYFLVTFIALGLLYFFPHIMLRVWGIPWLVSYAVWFTFLSMFEHYECDPQNQPFGNSRTLKENAFVRFFCWNDTYHAEHHLYPSVPFYQLPTFNRYVGANICYQGHSYLTWHWQLIRQLNRQNRYPKIEHCS